MSAKSNEYSAARVAATALVDLEPELDECLISCIGPDRVVLPDADDYKEEWQLVSTLVRFSVFSIGAVELALMVGQSHLHPKLKRRKDLPRFDFQNRISGNSPSQDQTCLFSFSGTSDRLVDCVGRCFCRFRGPCKAGAVRLLLLFLMGIV